VSDKEQRMYEHIKGSEEKQGRLDRAGQGDRGGHGREASQRERHAKSR
jgi:hypothetical protein